MAGKPKSANSEPENCQFLYWREVSVSLDTTVKGREKGMIGQAKVRNHIRGYKKWANMN